VLLAIAETEVIPVVTATKSATTRRKNLAGIQGRRFIVTRFRRRRGALAVAVAAPLHRPRSAQGTALYRVAARWSQERKRRLTRASLPF